MKKWNVLLISLILVISSVGCSSKERKYDKLIDELESVTLQINDALKSGDPEQMIKAEDRLSRGNWDQFDFDRALQGTELTEDQKIRLYHILEKFQEVYSEAYDY